MVRGKLILSCPPQRENIDEGKDPSSDIIPPASLPTRHSVPVSVSRWSCQCLLRTSHNRHPEAEKARERLGLRSNCPELGRLRPYG